MTDPQDATDASTAALALHPRHEQMFPRLSDGDIARLRRFATLRRYADGERLFEAGRPAAGMFVLLSGHVAVTQRDGFGHSAPVVDQGPGQFLGEISQLSGGPAPVDGTAEGAVEALLVEPAELRRLLIAEAELGERIVRALILRRVGLLQAAVGGPVIVGPASSPGVARLQSFLTRNGQPHHVIDPDADADARELMARLAPDAADLPLVLALDGSVLRNPSETELARSIGMVGGALRRPCYDVAVVGAGPAGLSTSVYAASEGLSVIVLDSRAFGGQAGASARIENYLGFPTGISGQALAGRAFIQAQKFGAEIVIPSSVRALGCGAPGAPFQIELDDGATIRTRTVVIASGARYRRPAIAALEHFEGRGVWYWASPIEARLCAGDSVMLVGGGNSAGQAAVFLSTHARHVTMLVRGARLADSMSSYLVDRIAAAPNIELRTEAEVVALDGDADGSLAKVRWRDRASGAEHTVALRHLFLFVGADPATEWLADCAIELDRAGFVRTGAVVGGGPLESSVPGAFAIGDVRSGSVKRVGAAIGEGAQVVHALHGYLAAHAEDGSAAA